MCPGIIVIQLLGFLVQNTQCQITSVIVIQKQTIMKESEKIRISLS